MTSTTQSFRVGDRVIADPAGTGVPSACLGRVFRVAKINPRNVKCTAEDGGRGINFPAELLLPAPPEGERVPVGRPYVERPWLDEGTVVTLKQTYKDTTTEDPLVVVKGGMEKVNVTRLGGEWGSRYMRIRPEGVVVRDVAWLTEHLLEKATA